ncbi:MAG TPA: sigma-70 family RNA polymerase sigma factor [Gemmataceae bacterium]|jgi:DNA-directed RNA polymerase specialized sigma24 family protein
MSSHSPRKDIRWTEKFRQKQSARLSNLAAHMKLPKRLIEDAVLEAWPKIVRQWESVRGPNEMQRFLAMSRKIMHDTAVDLLRHCDRHRFASLHDQPAEPIDSKGRDPSDELATKESCECVAAKLEELCREQPNYGWLLSEHYLKERPLEELAAEKGVTKHAMESQKSRALKALRRLMENGPPMTRSHREGIDESSMNK